MITPETQKAGAVREPPLLYSMVFLISNIQPKNGNKTPLFYSVIRPPYSHTSNASAYRTFAPFALP